MDREKWAEFARRAKNALIGSVAEDGYPNIRAMLAPRKQEGLERFYFSTNTASHKIAQFKENEKACLYFFDSKRFMGLLLIGDMQVTRDEEYRKMLWKMGDRMYYPKGIDDPDYSVMIFRTKNVRVYSNLVSESFEL